MRFHRLLSCENPEWEESETYAFLEALTKQAVYHLPGYEEAQWEIELSGLNSSESYEAS